MTATAAMLAEVRRMVAEPDATNGYSDDILDGFIEAYPLIDERGEAPYTWDTSTSPPTTTANTDWVVTYDLHAAAARVWEEKAAGVAGEFTFGADGGQYSRSDKYKHYSQMARTHAARRAPRTIRAYISPATTARAVWVGNLAEDA